MSLVPSLYERNQQATVYAGNIDQKVTESLLWELFTQCGPVVNVHIPRDKITNEHQGYGFVEFKSEEDADYSIKIMHMIKLYGKPIKVNKASQDKRAQDVGANLFIGNLDAEVDEKMLYETFGNFGAVISTKISRDGEDGTSKGHGFVSFDSFVGSDLAIAQMNGQYFSGRQVRVEYAVKKDSKSEKHGSFAQRLLAENKPNGLMGKMPNLVFNPGLVNQRNFRNTVLTSELPLARGGIRAGGGGGTGNSTGSGATSSGATSSGATSSGATSSGATGSGATSSGATGTGTGTGNSSSGLSIGAMPKFMPQGGEPLSVLPMLPPLPPLPK